MSSLVEVNPFPLAEPPSDGRLGEATDKRRDTNLMALAWRSRWLLLLMMIVGGGAGWAILQRVTPRYTSLSRIYVERNMPRLLDEQMQAIQSASYLYTQAELIRSGEVLAKVAEDPANANLETFRGVANPVALLRKHLEVNVGANDEIINVWIELPNAKDAAQLVNSVVDTYTLQYSENRKQSATELLVVLRNEKQLRDEELKKRREELTEYRQQHPELAVQVSQDNVVTLRFAALSETLNSTEIELLQAKALYNRVKKMYDTPTQRPYLLEMAGAEHQALRDSELERQVKQLEQALVSERARWGEGHPRVRLLADSLDEMKVELQAKQKSIIEGYVESLRQQFELLDHKRSELQGAYDRQFEAASRVSSLVVHLTSLQEELARTEKMCDALDDQIKKLDLTEQYASMKVNVLEPAGVSTEPSFPEPNKFIGIGILLGGVFGFGLSWLRDLLDHRLRSVDEVAEVLQLPVLGVLPSLGAARERGNVGRLVANAPRSPLAEAIRTLRTALHFGLSGQDAKTIAVTSPSPGDGKSTVASNLAIAMAQADQRVLLIDADMRKPTQHLIFEVACEKGLSSVLTERRPSAEAIVPSGVDSLDLMPCGPLPSNPVELLNNGFFAELLEELKGRYDKVIIDSPPVMPVADARVIAAVSDSTLLVLRAERSARRLSLAARNELWRVRAMRLGVVVNGVPNRKNGSYGYGYGQGDYGGYGGYGPTDVEKLPSARRKKSRALPSPLPAPAAAGDEI
jgi:polysaccharide biosynthesis transport protein